MQRCGGDSRNPIGVDSCQGRTCIFALLGLERADEDTIRGEEITDGRPFCEELWVGEDVEAAVGPGVCLENGTHRLGCAAWDG